MKPIQEVYQERTYRSNILKNNLILFNVTVGESDLFISADANLHDVALASLHKYRSYIETYIASHPDFLTSLVPVQCDYFAPAIIRDMMAAALHSNVGPMAAVAGGLADYIGRDLLTYSRNVIIENGGDIFINCLNDTRVGIFAGDSPLRDKITMIIRKGEAPVGVCTSSGTVGHSMSFGKADAVCVKARSASQADAAATAICNLVKSKRDINRALQTGMNIDNVFGILIIIGDHLGVMGNIELTEE